MFWCFKVKLFVTFHVFVNVFEGRGWGNRFHDAKTQSVCLLWLMIRILPNNDDLNILDGCGLEGVEDQLLWWVDLG